MNASKLGHRVVPASGVLEQVPVEPAGVRQQLPHGDASREAAASSTPNSGRYVRTGSSRSTSPSPTSCITRAVVQTLVTDPIWNRLSAVASTPVSRLITPVAASASSIPHPDGHRSPRHPMPPERPDRSIPEDPAEASYRGPYPRTLLPDAPSGDAPPPAAEHPGHCGERTDALPVTTRPSVSPNGQLCLRLVTRFLPAPLLASPRIRVGRVSPSPGRVSGSGVVAAGIPAPGGSGVSAAAGGGR